jgi:cytochrome P450
MFWQGDALNSDSDPIAAVTAVDPTSAYAGLLAEDTMVWNEKHRVTIAAKGADVEAVLADLACRVRPPGEPVPAALLGTSAGGVFVRLVRMNEGAFHTNLKRAISSALDGVDIEHVHSTSRRSAESLNGQNLNRFMFEFPVFTVAALLGVPDGLLPEISACTGAFVKAVAPGAGEEDIAHGCQAVDGLHRILGPLLAAPASGSLICALRDACQAEGVADREVIIANAIGFLFQAHDAMAGLIGNTVVHLARDPALIDSARLCPTQIERIELDVSRQDPAVQNTRRFVAAGTEIGEAHLAQGEVVLVALAAANLADNDRTWSFGGGRHECPGQSLALAIASEGVRALLEAGMIPRQLPDPMQYLPLTNVRIPVFAE